LSRLLPPLFLLCLALGAARALADGNDASARDALRARYEELLPELRTSQFEEPLYLDSSETSGRLTGSIYARLSYPFATVAAALSDLSAWCDALILPVNTKYCHASGHDSGAVLTLNVGSKHKQRLEDTFRLEFTYLVAETTPDYLRVQLDADSGPLGTYDYRILVEGVALESGETFLHYTYSYAYGTAARLAMNAYLATTGRRKVGFTVVGTRSDGKPEYIRGIRGVVERNTMRYYLAIDASLEALQAPPAEQLERRLEGWYDGAERYARQLHELDRDDYLEMKRSEYLRQQETPP
jgi:hypothetical protein